MKTNFLLNLKATILTTFLLLGVISASMATSFVASFSGNWSNASNWSGNQPGFNISAGDKVIIPAGVTITLDSALIVDGHIILNDGSLDLNGQNLTINGGISSIGLGSVIGNKNSNLTFSGYGGAGNIVFSSQNQAIKNLTINIGANSGMFLGSPLTVNGTLSLISGFLGLGNDDLTISQKGNMVGGSRSSYVINNGTGQLTMAVSNSGAPVIFQVGTQNNYAPVAVTNNSTTVGIFSVSAFEGVLAEGATGADISGYPGMVNTSWNISSSIANDASISLELFWNTTMQINGFNNAEAYVSQYVANGWNLQNSGASTFNSNGTLSLKLEGVTSLSQFAVFGEKSATGIKNVAADASFSLYPNPASQSINIATTQTAKFPILKIMDAAGNEVISQQIENNVTTLDINQLSRGIYFASLNGAASTKFIKQ